LIHGTKWIGRGYRHVNRYRQIISVLVRHGLGDFATKLGRSLGLGRRFFAKREATPGVPPMTRWQLLRMILEELGPSFVKLGQIASTRPDMIPREACAELEKLQDTVPPFPVGQVRQIIEAELGKPLKVLFRELDEVPVAAASIAQVHRGVLPDGTVVAVKVQRPRIRRTIEVDLDIMFHLARQVEKHFREFDVLDPVGLVREFSRVIKRELDFDTETANIERFARDFASDETIHIPRVFRDLSTGKVLTMEFIEGIKVSDLDALADANVDLELIADRGADIILRQIFEHGFFHADPHPGNILVLPDNVICLLDYGMIGTLTKHHREHLAQLTAGVVHRDERQMARALINLSQVEGAEIAESVEGDVAEFVERYLYRPLKDIHVGNLFGQFVGILARHKLKLPPVFYLLSKALAVAEGNGRRLSPEFNLIRRLEPFARRFMREKLSSRTIARNLYAATVDWDTLLRDFPSEAREILALMRQGRFRIQFEHKGLEPMLITHNRISNRIVYGLVLSSLVIGSSLIVLSGIPPKWHEIPIIGIVGFISAGVMGFWLLVSMLRRQKM